MCLAEIELGSCQAWSSFSFLICSNMQRYPVFWNDYYYEILLPVFLTMYFALQADNFQRQGKQLRRKMWFQNMKVKLIVLAIIIVIIIIIWLSICRGFTCSKGGSPPATPTPAAPTPPAKRRLLAYIATEIVN